MPSTSSLAAERRARVARFERLSKALDSRFRLPVIGLRVGWDSILGLVPGLGDLITAGPGAAMIYEGVRMGARKRALVRMGLNTGIDMTLGAVPLLGDIFDAFFKSHRRNVAVLMDELARIERAEEEERPWRKDTDPKMEPATAKRRSARKAVSGSRDDAAAHSSVTSQARMR